MPRAPLALLLVGGLGALPAADAALEGRGPVNYTIEAAEIRSCADSGALSRTVVLVGETSSDRVTVSRSVACFMKIVQAMAEESDAEEAADVGETVEIPLPKVDRESLNLIVEFASLKLREAGEELGHLRFSEVPRPMSGPLSETPNVLKDDAVFMDDVADDLDRLFRLTNAANFVDFPALLELCAARIAQMFIGKTPQQIRESIPASVLAGDGLADP